MPMIRHTWFFQQQGYGWTENFWKNGTDTNLNTYIPDLQNYLTKRMPLSGKETKCIAARVSVEDTFRDALFSPVGDGIPGDAARTSDAPDTAFLFNWRTEDGKKRRAHFMRGVWDDCIDEGGLYKPVADYTTRVNSYVTWVCQKGFGWLGAGTRTMSLLANVTQAPSGQVNMMTADPLFTVVNGTVLRVNVSGVKGAYQVNGSQLVIVNGPTQCITKNRISIFPWTAGGKITWSLKGHVLPASGKVERVVERKVGRPSFKSRGRRPAKVAS